MFPYHVLIVFSIYWHCLILKIDFMFILILFVLCLLALLGTRREAFARKPQTRAKTLEAGNGDAVETIAKRDDVKEKGRKGN